MNVSRRALIAFSSFILVSAAFPWTPGFEISAAGIHLSAHSLGNLGGGCDRAFGPRGLHHPKNAAENY